MRCRSGDDCSRAPAEGRKFCAEHAAELDRIAGVLAADAKRIRKPAVRPKPAPAPVTTRWVEPSAQPASPVPDGTCKTGCGRPARTGKARCQPCTRAGRRVEICAMDGCEGPARPDLGGKCWQHRGAEAQAPA